MRIDAKPPAPIAERLYRRLLRLYPEAFRREYQRELLEAFREQRREPRYRTPLVGAVGFWLGLAADLVLSAARCHRAQRRHSRTNGSPARRPHPPDRQEATAMETLLLDLRHAVRSLAKSPGFTAATVLLLALGLGSVITIAGVVDAVLLAPLPYPAPEELVMVWERNLPRDRPRNVVAPGNFLAWQEESRSFSGMAATWPGRFRLTGGEEPREVVGQVVTPTFFQVLAARPLLGRVFTPGPEAEAGDVVVVSHRFWRRELGSDPEALGRTVTLEGRPMTVIGVMAPDFSFLDGFWFHKPEVEVWTPWVFGEEARSYPGRYLSVVARRAPGVSLERAQAEMSALARRLEEARPDFNSGWGVNVVPLSEQIVGEVRPALLMLAAAVGLLLVIACANVANLLLARVSRERRQIAVRAALGATRRRLVGQLLVQTTLLALAGGTLGLVLASWGLRLLLYLNPGNLPRIEGLGIDGRTATFAFAASLATGLVFGLLPALVATRSSLPGSLREGSGGAVGGRSRLRGALVVSEVALAVLLSVGAGLLIKSVHRLLAVDPGLESEGLLTLRVSLPSDRYPEEHQKAAFFDALLADLRGQPGVVSASGINFLPLGGPGSATSFWAGDRPRPEAGEEPVTDVRLVEAGYFRTAQVPLLAGRTFEGPDREGAPAVAVVNRSLAESLWPGEDPLGKTVVYSWGEPTPVEVVGVVGDVKLTELADEVRPTLYRPFAQDPSGSMYLLLRTAGDPLAAVAGVRRAVSALDPDQPVTAVRTMDSVLASSVAQPRLNAWLLGLFATLATALAALGTYAVLAYSVAARRRELGVRMALGAGRGEVLNLVIRQGMTTVAAGLALGLAAAFTLTRWLESLLFQVAATGPASYLAGAALLATVALAATYLPARRASRTDPTEAMRAD